MKKKIALIFGGESDEHDVSIRSFKSVFENIDKNKYDITLIYIDQKGTWYLCNEPNLLENKKIIKDFSFLKTYDSVFPILHGDYGEDGKIQGLLEILHIPYVGCDLLSSAICMDKDITKRILQSEEITQTPYILVTKETSIKELQKSVQKELGYPCFVKPANSGSSVGACKVEKKEELEFAVKEALAFDKKILVEKYIEGREVEIALAFKEKIIISNIGEILKGEEFYSYDAKYHAEKNMTKVPIDLDKKIENTIKNYALKAYQVLGCNLARIDFFISKKGKVYLNEINTMPGFTNISMYPMLMEEIGLSFSELIDLLINSSIENKKMR